MVPAKKRCPSLERWLGLAGSPTILAHLQHGGRLAYLGSTFSPIVPHLGDHLPAARRCTGTWDHRFHATFPGNFSPGCVISTRTVVCSPIGPAASSAGGACTGNIIQHRDLFRWSSCNAADFSSTRSLMRILESFAVEGSSYMFDEVERSLQGTDGGRVGGRTGSHDTSLGVSK
jgi:hypothetical protein